MSRNNWRLLVLMLLLGNLLYYFWPRPIITGPVAAQGVKPLRLYVPPFISGPVVVAETEVIAEEVVVAMEVATAEPIPVAVESEPEPVRDCWELGPLPGEALVSLRQLIDEQLLEARLVKRQVIAGQEYWVYVDSAVEGQSRSEMKAKLNTLAIDSFAIPDGELTGSLSLGLFSSRSRAESLASKVAAEGVYARIYPRNRYRDEFWLIATEAAAAEAQWDSDFSAFPHIVISTSLLAECPF